MSIGDRVFEDLDADGIQDGGEPGVAGATVELYDAANTTAITTDVFGRPISAITTSAGGGYTFSDLALRPVHDPGDGPGGVLDDPGRRRW
ncbi:MAG: SdrD B-like domain-containing protein [Ilumatobacteraceae bacterium]